MKNRRFYELMLATTTAIAAMSCDGQVSDEDAAVPRRTMQPGVQRVGPAEREAPEHVATQAKASAEVKAIMGLAAASDLVKPVVESAAASDPVKPDPVKPDPVKPVMGLAAALDSVKPAVGLAAVSDPVTPVPAQTAVNAVREVTVSDVVVEVPTAYDEVSGTACSEASSARFHVDGTVLHRKGNAVHSCEGNEWTLGDDAARSDVWTTDIDGNLYASSQRRDSATGTVEVFVSKQDRTGALVWEKAIAMGKTHVEPTLIVASPAGVYVGGSASGQLPGNPPESAGKPWVARLDESGVLQWTRQERDISHARPAFSWEIDGNDDLYLLYRSSISGHSIMHKLNARGERMWATEHDSSRCEGRLWVSHDGGAMFYGGGYHHGEERGACVTKLDGQGQLVWTNTYVPRHALVVNETEGTVWKGQASYFGSMLAVGTDSMVLVGTYENEYQHGSAPPPSFKSAWVVTLDFEGQVQSTRHLRVGPLDVLPGETGSGASFSPTLAVLLPGGELRLLGTRSSRKRNREETLIVALPGRAAAVSPAVSPSPTPVPPAAAPQAKASTLSSLWGSWKD